METIWILANNKHLRKIGSITINLKPLRIGKEQLSKYYKKCLTMSLSKKDQQQF